MSETAKLYDLDALASPARAPKVRLFGREIPILGLSGADAYAIAVAEQNGDEVELARVALGVVERVTPDLTPEERARLNLDQIAAVLSLARGMASAVDRALAERQQGN